jgi:hypothetical protein
LGVALVGAVYAAFGGVMSAAYHEFGHQSLLNSAPLVLADRTPVKLPPTEDARSGAALPDPSGGDPFDAAGLPSGDPPPPGQAIPAMAPFLADADGSLADGLIPTERPALPRQDSAPGATDPGASSEWPVAAASETASGLAAAAPALAELTDGLPAGEASGPPAPTFKPLDAVPTVVADATSAADPPAADDGLRTLDPPLPSLKPMVEPSAARPERQPPPESGNTRLAADRERSLPDALRAWWTNLKILLASGPVLSARRAGDQGGDGAQGSFGAGIAKADSGDGGSSGGTSSRSGGSDNADDGGTSGGTGPSGGSAGGGSSSGDSAGSGGGSGASSGGGSGASSGGSTSTSGGRSTSTSGGGSGGGVSAGRSGVSAGGVSVGSGGVSAGGVSVGSGGVSAGGVSVGSGGISAGGVSAGSGGKGKGDKGSKGDKGGRGHGGKGGKDR